MIPVLGHSAAPMIVGCFQTKIPLGYFHLKQRVQGSRLRGSMKQTEKKTFFNSKFYITVWDLKSNNLKSALYEDQISNDPVFRGSGNGFSFGPNHQNLNILLGFQMVFDKWWPFVWFSNGLDLRISDPIRNPDHL